MHARLEAHDPAFLLEVRQVRIPAKSQVNRQVLLCAPDVIDIEAELVPVHVLELAAALLEVAQLTEHEVGKVVAGERVLRADVRVLKIRVAQVIVQPDHLAAEPYLVGTANHGHVFAHRLVAAIKRAVVIGVDAEVVVHEHRQLRWSTLGDVHPGIGQPEWRARQ